MTEPRVPGRRRGGGGARRPVRIAGLRPRPPAPPGTAEEAAPSGAAPRTGSQPPIGPDQPPVGPGQPPIGPERPPVGPGQPPIGPDQPPVGPGQPPIGPDQPPVEAWVDPFVAAAWLPDRQEVREADREEDQEGRHACAAAAEVPGRSGPAGPVAAGRRPRRGRILTAALGLLLAADLALGVTAALLAFRHAHLDAVATARREALAAAVKEIVPVLTLDYTTLKADERKALAGLTPAYGRRYYRAVLAPFDKLASQEHAQVQSSVSAAAVISASPSTVQVLAFVDTQKLNKTTPGGTIFGERLRLTLVRSGDRWLISDIVAE